MVTDWELVNDNHVVRLPRHGGLGAHRTRRTDLLNALLATIPADRVALVGLHAWSDDDYPHVAEWGLTAFGPEDLRSSSKPLLDWLAATGCSRVAIPFDVDRIDSNVIVLGLGAEPDGLTSEQVRRIVADVDHTVEVVGLTVAEFIPRHVLHLHQILHGFPLRGSPATSHPLPRG